MLDGTGVFERPGQWLRCALHAHSTISDGDLSPRALARQYLTAGFDVLAITEMPDNICAAAISIAFAAGGAVASIKTTPLLTASQAVEALRKAGLCGYKSITEISKAASAP